MQKQMKKPFIIAEMSGNHNRNLERALTIVDKAAEAGVGAPRRAAFGGVLKRHGAAPGAM